MITLLVTMHEDHVLPGVAQLAGGEVRVLTSGDLEREPGLIEAVDVIYPHVSHEQLAKATRLRWLQLMGAGAETILTDEVRRRDFVITNASGIHAEPITEHMFAMVLAVSRRLVDAWDGQRRRTWNSFDYSPRVGMLAGKTLGVLGVGAIGGHSARVGRGFGMRVVGLRRTGEPHPDVEQMFTPDDRIEFFKRSDVVMNSLPISSHTQHFVGRAELAAMPQGAFICNTGRGGTIHQEALIDALVAGHLGAALLDVTDPEPLPPDHPLWTTPNAFITPHYSGFHPGYAERASAIFLDNLGRFLRGEQLRNVVDRDWGY